MNEPDAYAGEGRSALDSMFSPKSVAVIGATDREGSVGRTVLERLADSRFSRHAFMPSIRTTRKCSGSALTPRSATSRKKLTSP